MAALEIPYSTFSKVFSKGKVHVARWRTQRRSIEKIFLDRADHPVGCGPRHAKPPPPGPIGNRNVVAAAAAAKHVPRPPRP